GTVEADALGERPLQLGRGDRHRLQHPEHVGEPEPDEPHVPLLDGSQYVLLLLVHAALLPDLLQCCCGCAPTGPIMSASRPGYPPLHARLRHFSRLEAILWCLHARKVPQRPGCPVVGARWWVPGGGFPVGGCPVGGSRLWP